jgi:hypothetical protein
MITNRLPSPMPPRAVVAVFGAPTAEHFVPARCCGRRASADRAVEHFDWLGALFNEHLETRDGRVWLSDRPGLGFTLSEQARHWTIGTAQYGSRP